MITETLKVGKIQNVAQFKERVHLIWDECEKEGRVDWWSEQQRSFMPDIDSTRIGFHIEVLFSFTEANGTIYPDWCYGTVVAVTSESTRML